MKAATKVMLRRIARAREAEDLRAVRTQAQSLDELPIVKTRDTVTFADVRFLGQQLPLSFAQHRLQAADRWWREACLAQSDSGVKRYQ